MKKKLNLEFKDVREHQILVEDYDIPVQNPIILIGELELGGVPRKGTKILSVKNIREIFCCQMDYALSIRWYIEGKDLCCEEVHANGTNHYLYREMRNVSDIKTFRKKIKYNENYKGVLGYYTKSLDCTTFTSAS